MTASLPRELQSAFLDPHHHVPIYMRRLPAARVLWVTPAMRDRHKWLIGRSDHGQTLEECILSACAYAVGDSASGDSIGLVDRYGGAGIAYNGGSGRSAVVNGFYVKGIGRTPLIGKRTAPSHSSGGAYLAECIKEVVWSSVVQAHFPHGAVPVFAIIDTGEVQHWSGPIAGASSETRCLLVRPAFLRPAHIERAALFTGTSIVDGALDASRVRHSFDAIKTSMHVHAWLNHLVAWASNWASQLGFAFAHRTVIGGATTSNVDWRGRFVDFGGFATVPSWGRFEPRVGDAPFGTELADLSRALRSLYLHHIANGFSDAPLQQAFEAAEAAASTAYREAVATEVLWLSGLSREDACALLSDHRAVDVLRAIGNVIEDQQAVHWALEFGLPAHRSGAVDGLWNSSHAPLMQLREALLSRMTAAQAEFARSAAKERAIWRPRLAPEAMNLRIQREIDAPYLHGKLHPKEISNRIDSEIATAW